MIKYIINEKEGLIIGIMGGIKYDAHRTFEKKMRKANPNMNDLMLENLCYAALRHTMDQEVYMPNSIKATAKCKSPDIFDVNVGKRLVKAKLMERYYRMVDTRVDRMIAYVKKNIDNMNFPTAGK